MGEHCRVWGRNANAEWTSLGSALSLTDALNSHAWLFHQKVLFKCELMHKFNYKPNKQQPSRLTQVLCHQWRRKQDPPSPQSCKETHSHENPSCLVQMRLEYLAETTFSEVLVLSSVSSWLNPAPLASYSGTWAPVWLCAPSRAVLPEHRKPWKHVASALSQPVCHQAAGSGPWGNCVGGKDGQSVAFVLRSRTDLATDFIGTFGAISAGQLFKCSAAGKPSCSHEWGSRWNPRVALQWFCVTGPYTQEGTLHPLPPHLQFVNPVSFSPYPPQSMQT